MNIKLIGWLTLVVLLLTACASAAGAGGDDTSMAGGEHQLAATELPATATMEREVIEATPTAPPATATMERETVESTPTEPPPTAEVESTPAEPALAGSDDASCSDPFGGQSVRFSQSYWSKTDFCKHSVPYSEFRSGGPPPDGIPPIDRPRFESVQEADEWLAPTEPVIAFELGDIARAYPLQILMWHEIVNDEVAGVPVAVTFCPLCNAAIVFGG